MSKTDYVWEKIAIAVDCLCGAGTFKKRLENATISALSHLQDDYLTGELAEDLKYVLDWSKRNMFDGEIQREPNELERKEFIEKILRIMSDTHEIRINKYNDQTEQ